MKRVELFDIKCNGVMLHQDLTEEEYFDTMMDLSQKFYSEGTPRPESLETIRKLSKKWRIKLNPARKKLGKGEENTLSMPRHLVTRLERDIVGRGGNFNARFNL